MKVRIASVGDLSPTQSGDSYIANLIVLIEGQSELMSLKVVVPNDKVALIQEGNLLDVVPTPRATFSGGPGGRASPTSVARISRSRL